MSFTLDSLLFYLQVDVAEAEQQQLQKLLTESRDFEALMSAHAEYTERLARGFFLRVWGTLRHACPSDVRCNHCSKGVSA